MSLYVKMPKNTCVLIDHSTKTLQLADLFLTNKDSTLSVKHATVFWNFKNITNDNKLFEVTRTNGTKANLDIKEGYWDFQLLKKRLEGEDIEITPNVHDNTCNVKIKDGFSRIKSANLKKFGMLLGFDENHLVTTTLSKSPKAVDVNLGLRYLTISCDLVDSKQNVGVDGRNSAVLTYLPVTLFTRLSSSVSKYAFPIGEAIHLKSDIVNSMTFTIGSNLVNVTVDVEILLAFTINI